MHPQTIFDILSVLKREMKTHTLYFVAAVLLIPGTSLGATTCSRANLTRCLDSACAINISSNPAARCQYCGTASAGAAPTDNGMRSISVGSSAKYNISDKDLKKAPTDPSERYAWAAKQCIKKVSGCTADDVADVYDELIEQSCKAAGISAEFTALASEIGQERTQTVCSNEIKNCVILDKNCGADYRQCTENADFDRVFAACSVESSGCDSHISGIRDTLIASRDNAVENREKLLANIVKTYQTARENRLKAARAQCENGAGRDDCVETVCQNNMINQCADGHADERSMAIQLCKFYDTACAALK